MPVLESLSNTVKGLQTIKFATLFKRNPRNCVLEPAVRKCYLKEVFSNNSQNSQECTCEGVLFKKVACP